MPHGRLDQTDLDLFLLHPATHRVKYLVPLILSISLLSCLHRSIFAKIRRVNDIHFSHFSSYSQLTIR
ncbi:hypothetical protein D3C75_1273660 [compost metagenome]